MAIKCIPIKEVEELARKLQGETVGSVKALIALWREKNNKDIDTFPTAKELNDFRTIQRGSMKSMPVTWARTLDNGYEVSTKGDKRFSALVAKFAEGTIIDGVDVGGRTIEDVYQNVIKKSGKGRAPAGTSRLNLNPTSVPEEKRNSRSIEVCYVLWVLL